MPSIHSDLDGKSVLITGGGTGIGAALVEGFVRQGSRVAFVDIAADESHALCERLAAETGTVPHFIHADLRDLDALDEAAGEAVARNGPVRVLVNNAARDDRHAFDEVNGEYWDNNLAINLRPHFFTAKAVVDGMRAAGGGSIVNFSSISFMINAPSMPAYVAAKAGIIGLTKGLAGQLGVDGIRVNAIAPGWVLTERQRKLWATQEKIDAMVARQCIRREMAPQDIVGPCLFLASDDSAMVTGQTLIVDGGII